MKTVLITGGSRGIGKAMVELFSERGYAVAFTYKSSREEASLLANKTGAVAICADSADEEQVARAAARAREALGHVDCLINNAGVSSFSVFTELTYAEWRSMLATNLDGAFLYSRAVAPDMIARGFGRIINITSMWGLVGASCEVHYSAAKAGLIGFTKALAKELGPSGITVNAIAPGVIDTEMNKTLGEEAISALVEETPLSRIGTVLDVAESAYFLAGEGASFITGEVLNVSGGFVI